MVVRKVAAHLCLTVIVKELKISVEQGRVVTTLYIIFSVIMWPRASCLPIYVYTALGREISLS